MLFFSHNCEIKVPNDEEIVLALLHLTMPPRTLLYKIKSKNIQIFIIRKFCSYENKFAINKLLCLNNCVT